MLESISSFQTLSASIGMVGFAYWIRGNVSLTKHLTQALILEYTMDESYSVYLTLLELFWASHWILKLATFFNWSFGCWFRWSRIFDSFEGPLGGAFENRESVIVAIVGCRLEQTNFYFYLFGSDGVANIFSSYNTESLLTTMAESLVQRRPRRSTAGNRSVTSIRLRIRHLLTLS